MNSKIEQLASLIKQIEQLRTISFDMPELLEIWEHFNSKQLELINN